MGCTRCYCLLERIHMDRRVCACVNVRVPIRFALTAVLQRYYRSEEGRNGIRNLPGIPDGMGRTAGTQE